MYTYVMSDIHGCFDEFRDMLKKINFSKDDRLILAGDYIDRGSQSYEMLSWIEHKPENVILLRGNHDEEFAYCIDLMGVMLEQKELSLDNLETTMAVYEALKELSEAFDYYGTIKKLIEIHGVTTKKLDEWNSIIREMPYVHKEIINGKKFVIVHAGYIEDLKLPDTEELFETIEDFYLNARDDAYVCGGIACGTVIAGHTPTIFENELPYNNGDVYSFYDQELDCKFYDIDCGCAYRSKCKTAKLACIRLEDEKVFYV